jgi:hypothetical protein
MVSFVRDNSSNAPRLQSDPSVVRTDRSSRVAEHVHLTYAALPARGIDQLAEFFAALLGIRDIAHD